MTPRPCLSFIFSMIPPPPRSTLFPYTTLFRSATFVVLGTGEARYEHMWRAFAGEHPQKIGVQIGFEERSEEHTSELQSRRDLVCRLLLEKKKQRQPARKPGQNWKRHQLKLETH